MKFDRIDDLADPRLAPYRNLKDRDLAREGGRFIAESEQVVLRLLASQCGVESILVSDRRLERLALLPPSDAAVYVISDELMTRVIGFVFHSGMLACGIRPVALQLTDLLPTLPLQATLMVLPDTNNTENLGLLMRVAAGFGVDALLLGPQCCDPFYRQAVRVSMGTVFSLRIIKTTDVQCALAQLKQAGFEMIATVLDAHAEPLETARRAERSAICFGNERQGLSSSFAAVCDRRVTIPMQLGTDSLNVAVAAGIVLFHFSRAASFY